MSRQSYSYSNPVLQIQSVGKGKTIPCNVYHLATFFLTRILAATDTCLFNTRIKVQVKIGGEVSSFRLKCRWWKLGFAIICSKSISPSGCMHFSSTVVFRENLTSHAPWNPINLTVSKDRVSKLWMGALLCLTWNLKLLNQASAWLRFVYSLILKKKKHVVLKNLSWHS